MEKGDKVYIGSSYYIDHGEDDICGGWAIVEAITTNKSLPEGSMNRTFVKLEELDRSYNIKYLEENQEKWAKEYGDKKAYACPDYV